MALIRRYPGAYQAALRRFSGAIHFLIKRCEGATKALLYIYTRYYIHILRRYFKFALLYRYIYAIIYIALVYRYALLYTCSRHCLYALQRNLNVLCQDITLNRRGMCMQPCALMGAMKALLCSIEALSRRYSGCFKELLRLYYGTIQALLYIHAYIHTCVCRCV